MFCCVLLCVHSSIAIILMGKRDLVALLDLSSWCLVMVQQLFLPVQWGCLRFVVFPDHTQELFSKLLKVSSCPRFIWETVPDVGGLISKRFPPLGSSERFWYLEE